MTTGAEQRGTLGAGRHVTRWRLFIDESGGFDRPADEVCVAGLLVRADTPGSDPAQIRDALRRAAPDLPWPIKASEMNRPVVFALAHVARRRAGREVEVVSSALHEIVESLRTKEPAVVEEAMRALVEGRRLDFEAIARLDRVAREEPRRYTELRRIADSSTVAIGRLIRVLAHGGGATTPVVLVGCGETVRGELGSAPDPETVRYTELLRGVITRAADIVARFEGRQQVELYVLERHVTDEVLGVPLRLPLHNRHVGPIARAVEETLAKGGAPRVTIRLFQVAVYDDRMHAALVLADFVANRVRRALQHPSQRLPHIERILIDEVPCPVRTGAPTASHLAAAGWAQMQVELVRSGGTEDLAKQPSGSRKWAAEQAGEWCAVLRR